MSDSKWLDDFIDEYLGTEQARKQELDRASADLRRQRAALEPCWNRICVALADAVKLVNARFGEPPIEQVTLDLPRTWAYRWRHGTDYRIEVRMSDDAVTVAWGVNLQEPDGSRSYQIHIGETNQAGISDGPDPISDDAIAKRLLQPWFEAILKR